MTDDQVCLAKIVGVHGIKGLVKVRSYTAYAEDFVSYGALSSVDGKKYTCEVKGISKDNLLVHIDGVDDRNKAEELRGTELYVSREILPAADDDEFYHVDLVGLEVRFENNKTRTAKITGIFNFGAGDVLEFAEEGKKPVMLPFVKKFVPVVDIKAGFVQVSEVDGLFDDEE